MHQNRQIRLWLVFAASLTLIACGRGNSNQSNTSSSQSQHQVASTLSKSETPKQSVQVQVETQLKSDIPPDVSYDIVGTTTVPGIKRSLDIRLNRRVSKVTLHAIALKLKASESQHYDGTFIAYYLPGMKVGAGAWATTHFDPDLKVEILGLTADAKKKLLAQSPEQDGRTVIGRWLDQSPYVGGVITIYRKDGKLYLEQKGQLEQEETLIESKSTLGRRFDMTEGSATGDHWIINHAGNLEIRDNQGLITTAKKVDS